MSPCTENSKYGIPKIPAAARYMDALIGKICSGRQAPATLPCYLAHLSIPAFPVATRAGTLRRRIDHQIIYSLLSIGLLLLRTPTCLCKKGDCEKAVYNVTTLALMLACRRGRQLVCLECWCTGTLQVDK